MFVRNLNLQRRTLLSRTEHTHRCFVRSRQYCSLIGYHVVAPCDVQRRPQRELSAALSPTLRHSSIPRNIRSNSDFRVVVRPLTSDSNENVATGAGPPPLVPKTKSGVAAQESKQTQSAKTTTTTTTSSKQIHIGDCDGRHSTGGIDEEGESRAKQNIFLVPFQEIQGKLQKIALEAQFLAKQSQSSLNREEVLKCADDFRALVNSATLDKAARALTKHDLVLSKRLEDQQNHQVEGRPQSEHQMELDEILSQTAKSMHALHRTMLVIVDNCIPPRLVTDAGDASMKRYSVATVGRALQLSRRAEELGFSLHMPLYQRLAMGIVVTSYFLPKSGQMDLQNQCETLGGDSTMVAESYHPKDAHSFTPLELPGQFQQIKEGLHTAPLSMELLDLCDRALVAHHIPLSRRQDFVRDILSEPFLQLLKQKQWEEALGLARGWESRFVADGGKARDDLFNLLGEEKTLEALEIAKSWLNLSESANPTFEADVQRSAHANELITILQMCLTEILKIRKERAEYYGQMLSNLIEVMQTPDSDDSDGESSGLDDDNDFGCNDDDLDSDSDGDDDWSVVVVNHGKESKSLNSSQHPQNEENEIYSPPTKSNGDAYVDETIPSSISFRPDSAKCSENSGSEAEPPVIEGVSNRILRQRIYLRNSGEWIIPDLVPQLEGWNKGDPLSFTVEFERHLGKQMIKFDEEDEDDWD